MGGVAMRVAGGQRVSDIDGNRGGVHTSGGHSAGGMGGAGDAGGVAASADAAADAGAPLGDQSEAWIAQLMIDGRRVPFEMLGQASQGRVARARYGTRDGTEVWVGASISTSDIPWRAQVREFAIGQLQIFA